MFEILTPSKKIVVDFELDGIPYNLDMYVSDCEVGLIQSDDILNYVPLSKINTVLDNYIQKLQRLGKLIIGGNNLDAIMRLRTNGQINPLLVNSLLFGDGSSVTQTKFSAYNPQTIVGIFQERGLEICMYDVNETSFIVGGMRP